MRMQAVCWVKRNAESGLPLRFYRPINAPIQ
jgi:hypothetical protein